MKNRVNNSLFNKQLVNASFVESFRKLDPRVMIKNPIMFTVEVVTFVMLLLIVWIAVTGNTSQGSLGYNIVIFLVLLATVLFANFAEAIAEARGKAQADSLLRSDLRKCCDAFREFDNDALLLGVLSYNVGIFRLKGHGRIPKSRLIRKLEKGERDIYEEYVSFRCYKGKVIPSIERRRKAEFALFYIP